MRAQSSERFEREQGDEAIRPSVRASKLWTSTVRQCFALYSCAPSLVDLSQRTFELVDAKGYLTASVRTPLVEERGGTHAAVLVKDSSSSSYCCRTCGQSRGEGSQESERLLRPLFSSSRLQRTRARAPSTLLRVDQPHSRPFFFFSSPRPNRHVRAKRHDV